MTRKNTLRFTPYAWGKLCFLRDWGKTEVSFMGVSSPEDLLLIRDVMMIKQECTSVFCELDGESMADYIDGSLANGVSPNYCARIWIHTHPGNSPEPSPTDEDTFQDIFGAYPWSVMAIIARGGNTYARLQFGKKQPINEKLKDSIVYDDSIELDMYCDWSEEFEGSDHEGWVWEYENNVTEKTYTPIAGNKYGTAGGLPHRWPDGVKTCHFNSSDEYVESDDYYRRAPGEETWWEQEWREQAEKEALFDAEYNGIVAAEDSWATKAGEKPDNRMFCQDCEQIWTAMPSLLKGPAKCPNCDSLSAIPFADVTGSYLREIAEEDYQLKQRTLPNLENLDA